MYFAFGMWAALLGASIRVLIRIKLAHPNMIGQTDQIYNVTVTAHAFVIIFFIVMPIIIGGFGN